MQCTDRHRALGLDPSVRKKQAKKKLNEIEILIAKKAGQEMSPEEQQKARRSSHPSGIHVAE